MQSIRPRGAVSGSSVASKPKLIDVASYCHHVPKMDPSRALDSRLEPNAWDITNSVLDSMRRKFRVVNIMSRELATVASTYSDRRREWRNLGGTPTSTASDNDGGLNEYAAKFEARHKQFGSLQHDQEDLAYPNDKPYSRLEQEEDSSDPASAHSPVASFKTEADESRRSNSAATSIQSAFTPVNPNNTATPRQAERSNCNVGAPNDARLSYGPPTSQAQQHSHTSQSYSAQTLPYGQSPSYGYSGTAPTFTQPAPNYGLQSPYARTSGPNQAQGDSSYNSQGLMELEREGNRSLTTNDFFFYQNDRWADGFYSIDQVPSQSQYLSEPQAPYGTYPNQWSGQ